MKRDMEWDDKFTSLKVGPNVAVTVRISNQKLVCDWSPEWAQWDDLQNSIELKQLIERANDKLQQSTVSKRSGKSKQLHTDDRLAELLGELNQCQWEVVLFSETRRNSDHCQLARGHKLYSSSQQTVAAGVAILVNRRLLHGVIRVHVISDRLMFLDLQFGTRICRLISVYMPHAGYPHDDLCKMYDQLQWILADAHKRKYAFVNGGDFNTQWNVGLRGEMIREFSQMFGLCLANLEQLPESWTFRSSAGIKRQIDFILFNSELCCETAGAVDVSYQTVRIAVEAPSDFASKHDELLGPCALAVVVPCALVAIPVSHRSTARSRWAMTKSKRRRSSARTCAYSGCCSVDKPLLRHHLPLGSDSFARDADPRSLDYLGAPSEQAGSRASERVVTESVDLCSTAVCRSASAVADRERHA
eukprot:s2119_g1.t1